MCGVCCMYGQAGGVCVHVSHVSDPHSIFCVLCPHQALSPTISRSLDSVPLPQNHCYTYISLWLMDKPIDWGREGPRTTLGVEDTPFPNHFLPAPQQPSWAQIRVGLMFSGVWVSKAVGSCFHLSEPQFPRAGKKDNNNGS